MCYCISKLNWDIKNSSYICLARCSVLSRVTHYKISLQTKVESTFYIFRNAAIGLFENCFNMELLSTLKVTRFGVIWVCSEARREGERNPLNHPGISRRFQDELTWSVNDLFIWVIKFQPKYSFSLRRDSLEICTWCGARLSIWQSPACRLIRKQMQMSW